MPNLDTVLRDLGQLRLEVARLVESIPQKTELDGFRSQLTILSDRIDTLEEYVRKDREETAGLLREFQDFTRKVT